MIMIESVLLADDGGGNFYNAVSSSTQLWSCQEYAVHSRLISIQGEMTSQSEQAKELELNPSRQQRRRAGDSD